MPTVVKHFYFLKKGPLLGELPAFSKLEWGTEHERIVQYMLDMEDSYFTYDWDLRKRWKVGALLLSAHHIYYLPGLFSFNL